MSSVRRIFIILSSVIPTLREGAKTINLTIIVVVQVLFFGIAAVFFFSVRALFVFQMCCRFSAV